MKSFRLDRQSIDEFLSSWPSLLIALAITGGLAYAGWLLPGWRIVLVLFAGGYFGYALRGTLTQSIAERYPMARCRGLLAVGMVVLTLGVLARFSFPESQTTPLDAIWLSTAFVCILLFIIINRKDPDVFR